MFLNWNLTGKEVALEKYGKDVENVVDQDLKKYKDQYYKLREEIGQIGEQIQCKENELYEGIRIGHLSRNAKKALRALITEYKEKRSAKFAQMN